MTFDHLEFWLERLTYRLDGLTSSIERLIQVTDDLQRYTARQVGLQEQMLAEAEQHLEVPTELLAKTAQPI